MRKRFRIFLTLFGLCCSLAAHASPITLDTERPVSGLTGIEFLVDETNQFDITQIRSEQLRARFQSVPADVQELNFGLSKATYWLKLTLQRTEGTSTDWVLDIPFFGLDKVSLYSPDGRTYHSGLMESVSSQPLPSRFFAFPIHVNTSPLTYYIEVRSGYPISIPLKLVPQNQFFHSEQLYTLAQAVYFGGLITLALYNLLIFLSLRDRSFLLYFLFATSMGLGMFSGNGFARVYLWPNLVAWDQISQSFFFALSGAFGLKFAQSFLNTSQLKRASHQAISVISYAYLLVAILMPLSMFYGFGIRQLYSAFFGLTIPMVMLLFIVVLQAIRNHQHSAHYFAIAWGSLCAGAIIAYLRIMDLVPSNIFTNYALQVGSAFEMVMLSLALADRIHSERLMREQAKREALASKEAALRTLRESEARLEHLVKERTNYLELLLENEKNVRAQYVRFGAMISHEFRNPLGIIETQLKLLKHEFQLGINQFEKRYKTLVSATQRLAILFERWVQSDRLNNMMEVIRPTRIELNAWLSDLIRKYRSYQANHRILLQVPTQEVHAEFDEQLLQTAILNLIDNACKYSSEDTDVNVTLSVSDNEFSICVTDIGIGIDPGHHEAIFKEYFRVNENSPTRGIGLGLAFVKKIAELHGGRIEVASRISEGTRMCLRIPYIAERLKPGSDHC